MKWPRKTNGFTLRLRFVLPISAMLVVSMFLMSAYLISRQSDNFHTELESRAATMIKMLAVNVESGVLFESRFELEEVLAMLDQFEDVEYCRISNIEGTTLAESGINRMESTALNELRSTAYNSDRLATKHLHDRRGDHVFVQVGPVTTEKKQLSRETLGMTAGVDKSLSANTVRETIGWIELGISENSVHKDINQAKVAAIVLTALILGITIMIVIFIVSAVTKPVTELAEATDHISRGDFSRRVDVDRFDEIGQLARTFNRMTESLRDSREEIEQYNRTLEEKIIERTRQLEEAQAQLIQSEKMSAIGQLAAGVAHELNNPLGGILGYAQFTLEKLRKNVPDKTSEKEISAYIRHVTDIETQARRCKTIVQNLLRFSRTSKGVEFEHVDINKAIEETASFVRHQLKINQIDLNLSLAKELPQVNGNSSQLQQVFTNLIINAMHASSPGSEVRVTTRFSAAVGEFGGAVELKFADDGHGIPKENLNKVFEPFFTTKEVGKGTGLGLSVSYGIIRDHGGEISVESEPGHGTTFTVVLPVQQQASGTDSQGIKIGVRLK